MIKINGFRFSLFEIKLTNFDGYGFTILNIGIDTVPNITITKGGSLFHLSFRKHHEYKGLNWKIHLNLLFHFQLHKIIKVIVPTQNYCIECEEYFVHEPFAIKKASFDKNVTLKYCSKDCYYSRVDN